METLLRVVAHWLFKATKLVYNLKQELKLNKTKLLLRLCAGRGRGNMVIALLPSQLYNSAVSVIKYNFLLCHDLQFCVIASSIPWLLIRLVCACKPTRLVLEEPDGAALLRLI